MVFYILLFLIALLYSSVGHGGASGYLALLALYGKSPDVMKPTALLLNLFVSGTAFIQYYRQGHFRASVFWPLAIASIPFAFLGGSMPIATPLYKQLLGAFLVIPALRFLFFDKAGADDKPARNPSRPLSLLIGAGIGFLSGLLGIGGGIILSPVLLLLGWANTRESAALSALFIFVNSVAGLGGQFTSGVRFDPQMAGYVVVAFAGGLAGAYIGAFRLPQPILRKVLAVVLLVAAYKLIFV